MKPNDFSDARVLVTGGAGFIGSALVWALNRRGNNNKQVRGLMSARRSRRNAPIGRQTGSREISRELWHKWERCERGAGYKTLGSSWWRNGRQSECRR